MEERKEGEGIENRGEGERERRVWNAFKILIFVIVFVLAHQPCCFVCKHIRHEASRCPRNMCIIFLIQAVQKTTCRTGFKDKMTSWLFILAMVPGLWFLLFSFAFNL